ncbi:LysM domain-containing protein [Desulfosporosinus sp. PR]|uniref:LysM peptidoglycan-binding domain-containing protein n=1 Tax=Candidatus Desulfosporosinus nitrosoreducens TaxID=3401928 RepID=UPI0027F733D8|nr:LysM domain-containing protein [Desulfosporosinus sp. PR]MDQ7095114.1 LysM domain-containing protein [Desulfosporosinus sp. PR]
MYYTVQPGDSLYNIALQYNTTVNHLTNLNPRISNPNKIRAGERIKVDSQWGFNPWWGNEWQEGIEAYQKGVQEYRKGRAQYHKGRKEYAKYRGR